MKLQRKIALILILSMFLAAVLAFIIINLSAVFLDRSYSWNDLEKIAIEASKNLSAAGTISEDTARDIILSWKKKNPNLEFLLFNEKRELLFGTITEPPRRPELEELKKHLAEEERQVTQPVSLRFIDTVDRAPFMVWKPVMSDNKILGMLTVSVRNDYFLPFYIRVNKNKITESYLILFTAVFVVVGFSFLFVFFLTTPLVRRLRTLYASIDGFKLHLPGTAQPSVPPKDEIGFIQNTFNAMAEGLRKEYAEREHFFTERQELLRNISHDFRTPLTSILGFAVSLEEGVYDSEEERQKYISIIRKKAEYMTKLFNEMMELTRLDAPGYTLNKKQFNFSELVREVIIEYLPQLENDGFEIHSDIPEILTISGDRERLSRMLRNLIENVATHAKSGKYIRVTVKESAQNGTQGNVILSFTDRGPGIQKNQTEKVFDRFYSGNGSGMGLGLAIAREIVEKHDGSISLDNNGKTGTVFTVTLPA